MGGTDIERNATIGELDALHVLQGTGASASRGVSQAKAVARRGQGVAGTSAAVEHGMGGGEVVAGGTGVLVACHVDDAARGKLYRIGSAAGQIVARVEGQGAAGDGEVGAAGCVVGRHHGACCGFEQDVACAPGDAFAERQDDVRAHRHCCGFVGRAEAQDRRGGHVDVWGFGVCWHGAIL